MEGTSANDQQPPLPTETVPIKGSIHFQMPKSPHLTALVGDFRNKICTNAKSGSVRFCAACQGRADIQSVEPKGCDLHAPDTDLFKLFIRQFDEP